MSYTINSDLANFVSMKGKVMNQNVKEMHNSLINSMVSIEKIIASQNYEIELEKEDERTLNDSATFFYVFTTIQVIVILFLFIYQILKYKRATKNEQ